MTDLGLIAMDEVDEEVLEEMRMALEDNFPVEVRRAAQVTMAGNEYDAKRQQHSAPLVLSQS